MSTPRTTILFLAADPSDASRLRLGQELRDIQMRLQLANAGEHFTLQSRTSVRPGDLSQALFDVRPAIVHFAGHGSSSGKLLLENDAGQAHPVTPEALESLFALHKKEVRCVLLNACYSSAQALAISKHIDFVIGMRQAIGDPAAIAFAVGFYKALAAGQAIRECFEFGLVELQLHNIPEHDTPVLLERSAEAHLLLTGGQYLIKKTSARQGIQVPDGYPLHAKLLFAHGSRQGCILVDPERYRCIGHILDDIYTNYLRDDVKPFSYGSQWVIEITPPLQKILLIPWQWALAPGARRSVTLARQAPAGARPADVAPSRRDLVPEAQPHSGPQDGDVWTWQRETLPASIGLTRGAIGLIRFYQEIELFNDCMIIASNNPLIFRIATSDPKALGSLCIHDKLRDGSAEELGGDGYRYKIVIRSFFWEYQGRVLIDTGGDLAEELAYWDRGRDA